MPLETDCFKMKLIEKKLILFFLHNNISSIYLSQQGTREKSNTNCIKKDGEVKAIVLFILTLLLFLNFCLFVYLFVYFYFNIIIMIYLFIYLFLHIRVL